MLGGAYVLNIKRAVAVPGVIKYNRSYAEFAGKARQKS